MSQNPAAGQSNAGAMKCRRDVMTEIEVGSEAGVVSRLPPAGLSPH